MGIIAKPRQSSLHLFLLAVVVVHHLSKLPHEVRVVVGLEDGGR